MGSCALEAPTIIDKIFLPQMEISLPTWLFSNPSNLPLKIAIVLFFLVEPILLKVLKRHVFLLPRVPYATEQNWHMASYFINSNSVECYLIFSLLHHPPLQTHLDLKKAGTQENVNDVSLPCNQYSSNSDSDLCLPSSLNTNLSLVGELAPHPVYCQGHAVVAHVYHRLGILVLVNSQRKYAFSETCLPAFREHVTISEYSGDTQLGPSLWNSFHISDKMTYHLVFYIINPFGSSLPLYQECS